MSSTGGGIHHRMAVTKPDGSETDVEIPTHALRQMAEAIRYVKPTLYAAIMEALGDSAP